MANLKSIMERENEVWMDYLKESSQFLKFGQSKSKDSRPMNQVNHVGANIVKMKSTRVTEAALLLLVSKKTAGSKGHIGVDVSKMITN